MVYQIKFHLWATVKLTDVAQFWQEPGTNSQDFQEPGTDSKVCQESGTDNKVCQEPGTNSKVCQETETDGKVCKKSETELCLQCNKYMTHLKTFLMIFLPWPLF